MPNAVRVVLTLAALVTTTGAAPAAQTAAPLNVTLAQNSSKNGLGIWLEAARHHRWGEADAPAAAIAALTTDDLEQLLPGLVYYLDCGRRKRFADQQAGQPGLNVTSNAVCASCDESSRERRRLLRETQSRAPSPERLWDFPLPNRLNDLIIRGVIAALEASR